MKIFARGLKSPNVGIYEQNKAELQQGFLIDQVVYGK